MLLFGTQFAFTKPATGASLGPLDGLMHRLDELVNVERFGHNPHGSTVGERVRNARLRRLGGDQDYGWITPARISSEQLQQLEARDARQVHVHNKYLDVHVTENGPRGGGVVDNRCTPAGHVVEQSTQQVCDGYIVLHHKEG